MKTIINIDKKNIKNYIIVFIAGLIFGWVFFHNSGKKVESEHDHSEQVEKATVWTCSMHPQIKQNKPGLCPICAMELIPLNTNISDEEGVDPNEIQMSESAMKLAQIQTIFVKKEYSNKEVYLLGKIKPDERNISELTARFGGRIEKLFVNFTGQNVRKGEKLAIIYSPELVTAQRELLEAIEYKESNPSFYMAIRNKLKLWDLTEAQIDGIETKGEPQNYFNVLSPMSGTVTMRHVAIGDYVKEGNALFQVIDLTKVWVMFEAYESDLPWLSHGDNVEFTVQAIPGNTYKGKVNYIDPFLNAKTRIANVRVEVNNPKLELKLEMFTNGIIKPKITNNKKDLLIPRTSVLWTGKRSVVYVKVPQREHNSFLYREITLGPEAGEFYIILDGLKEGEEIAVNGVFKIDAAAQLEGKTSMMNPAGGIVSTGHNHGGIPGNSEKSGHESHEIADENIEHASFKVSGNCQMCKNTIEKAANDLAGVNKATWDIESKKMHVSYHKQNISLSKIHKAIAVSGYDTEKEIAPKETYDKLPPCCQYTRASSNAKTANLEHVMFKVSGNCEMCKNTIESTANGLDGVNSANWDIGTKKIHISFNKDKMTLDKIHKAIAASGYDTEKEKASKEIYDNLPECCQYTR